MAATGKRLALTHDQRSMLESVYDMQKLPDAELRDKLSKYLGLSTRQIQVWFQNRRQRAKTGSSSEPTEPRAPMRFGAVSPDKKSLSTPIKKVPSSPSPKSTLNTPQQIMDALFDFASVEGGSGGSSWPSEFWGPPQESILSTDQVLSLIAAERTTGKGSGLLQPTGYLGIQGSLGGGTALEGGALEDAFHDFGSENSSEKDWEHHVERPAEQEEAAEEAGGDEEPGGFLSGLPLTQLLAPPPIQTSQVTYSDELSALCPS